MAFGAVLTWQSISMGVESKARTEAGTSPAAIGGILEPFPSSLFPNSPEIPDGSTLREIRTVQTGNQEPLYLGIFLFPTTPNRDELRQPATVVEAASARVAAQGGTLTEAEAIAALRAAGAPEEWIPAFIAIGLCESRLSPLAKGDGGNSLGWLQVWRGWGKAIGVEAEALHDPVTNARAGVYVRTVRGRFGGGGGWSCADHLGIY